jgi:MraZ protein
MLLGDFEYALDDRGRLAIPAKFRSDLGNGLVVTRGLERCLVAWPMDEWRVMANKLTALSPMRADVRRLQRLFFSNATDVQMDRLGRILIPTPLRQYAELRDSVVVVGLVNRLELWSTPGWNAERTMTENDSLALANELYVNDLPGKDA